MTTASFPLESHESDALVTVDVGRLPLIDAVKGVAALLIVLHHLAFYGPLSDVAYPLAPALLGWLSEYARMAVQAFLVIAGFGAARRLARLEQLGLRAIGRELWTRGARARGRV